MVNAVGVLPLIVILICIALFIVIFVRDERRRMGRPWLVFTLVAMSVTAAAFLIPQNMLLVDRIGRGFAITLGLAVLLIAFGTVLIRDVTGRTPRIWLGAGLTWLVILILAALTAPEIHIGEANWLLRLQSAPDAAGLVAFAGILVAGIMLPGAAFYGYYHSKLPEITNRALLWLALAVIALCGSVLIISGQTLMMPAGLLALLLSVSGAVHAQTTHRAFDLRASLHGFLRTLLLVSVTAALIFAAVMVAEDLGLLRDPQSGTLVLLLSLVAATLYIPIRQVLDGLLQRILGSTIVDPTAAARKYSQQISKTLELKQLADTVSQTLEDAMKVRRSRLLLVNKFEKGDEVVTLRLPNDAGENGREMRFQLGRNSPILRRWLVERTPVTQFDMEFNPAFKATDTIELDVLRALDMSAFAPIMVDDVLIGVLACGAKRDGTPFYPRDLDLLATMADQTGIALRNARLVADLRQLNTEMQVLNRGLEATKEQMEKLDDVKTDFITIASHELRTPLAQIRGYSDLVDTLNEQGMIDPDHVSGMVDNIRKATQRMEELITAMLDVSQLDVKAMDLRFTQASVESILRMSIEPLADAARQRKLSLSARGLRGLPVIEADMQRLVQAFRNVIVNAIKFTPDGGRIDITAETILGEDDSDNDRIRVKIADTGVGIDKNDLELIFRKFYRVSDPNLHSTGMYKFMGAGPGLGLTIAKGVIEGHGGKVWVESPGHDMEKCPGSTFYIELPLKPSDAARHVMTFGGASTLSDLPETMSTEMTLVHSHRDET
ncbi:MAG: GAF domain-containing protein [Anaerolineae bacterium]|nr:GAF domain-containing protein [Anaerolineae bacterium]MCA9908632.1 GAF domain-containing protein [Anaerolineae bacterium]